MGRGLSPAHLSPSSCLTSFPAALALAQCLQLLSLSLRTLPGAGPAGVFPGPGTVWVPFLQAQGWLPRSFSLSKRAPSDLFQTELPSTPEALVPFCLIYSHSTRHSTIVWESSSRSYLFY